MMLVLQVYKLAYSEWQNSLLGLRIIVEKTSYQHQHFSSQVDFGGAFGISLPYNYDLCLRRHYLILGARLLLW